MVQYVRDSFSPKCCDTLSYIEFLHLDINLKWHVAFCLRNQHICWVDFLFSKLYSESQVPCVWSCYSKTTLGWGAAAWKTTLLMWWTGAKKSYCSYLTNNWTWYLRTLLTLGVYCVGVLRVWGICGCLVPLVMSLLSVWPGKCTCLIIGTQDLLTSSQEPRVMWFSWWTLCQLLDTCFQNNL